MIGPGGEIVVGALHGLVGGVRRDKVPIIEIGAPLAVECRKRAVALFEPGTHLDERLVGEVEIPERRQVSHAGFIAEAVKEWPVGRPEARGVDQSIVDSLDPDGVGETGVALESLLAGRVFLIKLLRLKKLPMVRPIGIVAMVLGVEIGRDIFGVPAQIVIEEELREVAVPANILAAVNAQRLQRRK